MLDGDIRLQTLFETGKGYYKYVRNKPVEDSEVFSSLTHTHPFALQ